ncbi:MAG: tRNA (adenosine(37)-N6)-dimethylallyltransferase MiaA [Terriglobia bacterium]
MIGEFASSLSNARSAPRHTHVFSQSTSGLLPDSDNHHMHSADPSNPLPRLKTTESDYPVVAILGPTASGKSALSLALAERLGAEVVNYDSVQLYGGFDIGSGKLKEDERRGIPHYLLGIAAAGEAMTAGEYRRQAQGVLDGIRSRRNLPVLAGGSGLYLRSLTDGLFDGPERSEEFRVRLRQIAARRSREFLHKMLGRLDPQAARRIHPRDAQKVIRAIEVCWLAGEAMSRLQSKGRRGIRGFSFIKIGLDPNRSQLYERINHRVEQMFSAGLVEETRAALSQLEDRDGVLPPPFQALGYRQAVAVLRGAQPLSMAIPDTKAATRRYAKRQLTWFRKEAGVRWFRGFGDQEETIRNVLDYVAGLLAGLPGPAPDHLLASDALYSPERDNP